MYHWSSNVFASNLFFVYSKALLYICTSSSSIGSCMEYEYNVLSIVIDDLKLQNQLPDLVVLWFSYVVR